MFNYSLIALGICAGTALHEPAPSHRHSPSEQSSRTLGTLKLPPARSLHFSRRLRRLVQHQQLSGWHQPRPTSPRRPPSLPPATHQGRRGKKTPAEEGDENLRRIERNTTGIVYEAADEGSEHFKQRHGGEGAAVEYSDAAPQVLQSSVPFRRGRTGAAVYDGSASCGQLRENGAVG